MDLNHPLVQSVVLPLLVGLLLTGVARLTLGRQRGPQLASAAVSLGFGVAVLLILGLPSWPPVSGLHKLVFVAAGSLLLGLWLDWRPEKGRLAVGATFIWPLLVFAWLTAQRLRHPTASLGLELAALYAGALVVLWRLDRVRSDPLIPAAMLLSTALGLGVVAISASLALGQLAFALAAALGGFMLLNWPKRRDQFGYSGIFGVGGALLALVGLTLLLTKVPPAALAVLGLIFFADTVSSRLPPVTGPRGQALRPVYLVLVALLPIAIAIAISYLAPADDSPYYSALPPLPTPSWPG